MTNRLIYLALALFLGVTILVNCDTTKRSASVQGETTRFDGNPLALYGEALYESAACNNCHTQQIANLDVQLVSLDGVGGKYPNSWLYYYLFDPEGIKAHAEMPSYAELYTTPLEESVLQRKLQEGGWEAQQESLWEELLDQAESLTKELRSQDVSIPQTEILALMAYVQQIPSSKQKQLLEQAELAEERRKEEIWEE
jgi:cbb3-type cytochrome oxidase cytochrome c subunit